MSCLIRRLLARVVIFFVVPYVEQLPKVDEAQPMVYIRLVDDLAEVLLGILVVIEGIVGAGIIPLFRRWFEFRFTDVFGHIDHPDGGFVGVLVTRGIMGGHFLVGRRGLRGFLLWGVPVTTRIRRWRWGFAFLTFGSVGMDLNAHLGRLAFDVAEASTCPIAAAAATLIFLAGQIS